MRDLAAYVSTETKSDGRAGANRHTCEGDARCARQESDKRRSRRTTDLVNGIADSAIRVIGLVRMCVAERAQKSV